MSEGNENDIKKIERIPIKAYFKSDLAKAYGVSGRNFRDMINRAKGLKGIIGNEKLLNVKQVELIFEKLGRPVVNR